MKTFAVEIDREEKSVQPAPMMRWALAGVCAVVIVAGGWWYLNRDPLRTVPELPVREFLENPAPFVGQMTKAELSVAGELGNAEGKGRLIAFADSKSGSQIVALVPTALDTQILSKNQKYVLKLKIEKGGLARVDYLRKL